MRQNTSARSEQLRLLVRDLERENKRLDSEVAHLQRRLRRLETAAQPLNIRLARSLQTG